MKYIKKPVTVEAYQTDREVIIHTLEGDMKASVGDYIITGVNGEQYPCKPDIFEKTYDEARENASELPVYKDVSSLEDVTYEHQSDEFVKGVQFILGKLYALPAAQLDLVPSAAWELHDSGSATCSRCHRTQKNIWDADNIQRYCGSCGARMRIEESIDEQ